MGLPGAGGCDGVLLRALVDGIDSGSCAATNAQRSHIAAAAEVICQLASDASDDGRRP